MHPFIMQKQGYLRFDKEITGIVKAFAIIFMMILHCYCTENYDVSLDFSRSLINGFSWIFKICVGMFVFMVGYGYAFSNDKDLKYSFKHIKKLLIPFWIILFVFTFPFCYGRVISDFRTLIYNLVGIDSSYNYYSWFVYFFIYAMCVMPFISRFINRNPLKNTVIVIVIAYILVAFVHELPRCLALFGITIPLVIDNKPHLALFNCLMMTPCMVLGYLFACKGYYERIRLGTFSKIAIVVLCLLVIIFSLVLKYYTYIEHNPINLDFFYAPLVIGAIAVLFNEIECFYLRKLLCIIGQVSVYMWFFHALFFTKAVRWFYQPVITIFDDINLVVLWTIVLTFFVSWILKSIVDVVLKHINCI